MSGLELRKDYFLERWVLVGSKRNLRVKQFKRPSTQPKVMDHFAPGSEHLTPPEIGRLGTASNWRMRWFSNKFPFVDTTKGKKQRNGRLFTNMRAYGHHVVLVETPSKKEQLWDFPVAELTELLNTYVRIIKDACSDQKVRYVQVFKNHGAAGGASVTHSHTQIVATEFVPPLIKEEVAVTKKFGRNCYRKVIAAEMKGARRCYETERIAAFTPFASRFNYEVWIFPKRFVSGMASLRQNELEEMAAVLKKVLAKLKSINAPFNILLHQAPKNSQLHMHFEVTPRIQGWAGYELSTGIIVNEILPEDAARFYRH